MAYKIINETAYPSGTGTEISNAEKQIVAVCDTASDLTDLGADWYPLSVAIVCDPFVVKIMNASGAWKDK